VEFEPGGLYRFEMVARRKDGSGGSAVSGPTFANRDQHQLTSDWQTIGHVFRVPDKVKSGTLRVGQWNSMGSHQFDSVRVVPVLPVHTAVGSIVLGQGESIRDGRYRFHGTFGHEGSNYHRTLLRTTTGFNSNRWTFGAGSEVVYRFEVPGCQFKDGKIALNVNYHVRGECVAEVSVDREGWKSVASQGEVGSVEVVLPEDMLPAKAVYLRLRAEGNGSFQVDRVEFEGVLDGHAPDGTGKTIYAEVTASRGKLAVEQLLLRDSDDRGTHQLDVTVRNESEEPTFPRVVLSSKGTGSTARFSHRTRPHETVALPADLNASEAGKHEFDLRIESRNPDVGRIEATFSITIPDYYRTDYGELLRDARGTAVWWCDATHKVPRSRALPTLRGQAVQMAAARNDREAVQVMVRRQKELKGLTATMSEFKRVGDDGVIGADRVQVLRAYYHFVDHPTDSTGVRDYWPDALPPLNEPIDVEANQNQPIWILVDVPADAEPGDYEAMLSMKGDGFREDVPIRLHVWDFTLPKRNHLETAFGLSVGNIFRYHGLKTEEDKRKVLDLYLKSFGEHRISPYDPAPLDPIRVKFLPDADPPRAEVDFTAFDKAMERAVEEYGFTNFLLRLQGMGGGTFHARYEPEIAGFGEDTPEYQAMFASQVKQIEAHLREMGWLDKAFVYWFDEPDPKDYEFVANGMKRLEKYAPGLTRMITEQPSGDFDAHVNVWCPVSHNYDHEAAEARREHGERFWWYVCTGPKAPYCTLFIDHPATELRVWHWQTWQQDIVGTLVWTSNYWTSSAAYPDEPQDPYEDPMGYVSGYSTPKGTKAFWGNGDGRFIYPPLAAATPSATPIIEPPVTSIRWEMLREGVEDYEYLYMLRELLEEKGKELSEAKRSEFQSLLEVPDSITKDMTTFATHPRSIYERRRAVAEAIEELGSGQ
jgi:Glycoside hydrolase 123, catalytic domain/Glycoside hydrolase 123 N-terminal domain